MANKQIVRDRSRALSIGQLRSRDLCMRAVAALPHLVLSPSPFVLTDDKGHYQIHYRAYASRTQNLAFGNFVKYFFPKTPVKR
jgi:hypothetical protein